MVTWKKFRLAAICLCLCLSKTQQEEGDYSWEGVNLYRGHRQSHGHHFCMCLLSSWNHVELVGVYVDGPKVKAMTCPWAFWSSTGPLQERSREEVIHDAIPSNAWD